MHSQDKRSTHKDCPLVTVIMSGGVGSRLWPLSREAHPKPFIKLEDGQSLLQKAYLRATKALCSDEIVTVTNRDLYFYTKDEYKHVDEGDYYNSFILEPFGRNSSAAVALAVEYSRRKYGENCIVLVLPADHLIAELEAFTRVVDDAIAIAKTGDLVTFGITPKSPETGYGYIEADGNEVKRFVEKPNLAKAEEYLRDGNFLWNSGMFCMTAKALISEMNEHCPSILSTAKRCLDHADKVESDKSIQIEVLSEDFDSMEDISIDYSVFEKSQKVAVVPCDIGWSDIGSWVEFGNLYPKDDRGNNVYGEAVLEDVNNCVIHAENRLVAGIGIKDLIISDTQGALLVARKDCSQDVRKIVKALKSREHETYKFFPTVHRPWGNYTTLQESNSFKIKRIEVKPNGKLSLQSHEHRSEHWVIVSGSAVVLNGDETLRLERNESTYIPIGNKHRLHNPTDKLLVLIEVQCGDYLGEDDIIRYEDIYGRA